MGKHATIFRQTASSWKLNYFQFSELGRQSVIKRVINKAWRKFNYSLTLVLRSVLIQSNSEVINGLKAREKTENSCLLPSSGLILHDVCILLSMSAASKTDTNKSDIFHDNTRTMIIISGYSHNGTGNNYVSTLNTDYASAYSSLMKTSRHSFL